MKKQRLLIWGLIVCMSCSSQSQGKQTINLIVRGDDMGSSHAANLGCIQAYREGILKSVEIMVPCPWFPEAVKMIRENPGLDVGVHLTLTSEWENIKWRPVSCVKSLTDKDGYFFPMIWPNDKFPAGSFLLEAKWKPEEIEQEFRAQIEMALRYIPMISHISAHMGCTSLDPKVKEIYTKLALEYKLKTEPEEKDVNYANGWEGAKSSVEAINLFTTMLEKLKPGTYIFIEHPAILSEEMEAIGHTGNYTVAKDRDMVCKVFTSNLVKKVIRQKGIRLISYKDLK